jgi:hypothetical protein
VWFIPVEEIAKEVEKSEKGWIMSSLGRAWSKVSKHFKNKHLFLAHSSRLLLSLVDYQMFVWIYFVIIFD